jgi:gliding motility-associated-like protein
MCMCKGILAVIICIVFSCFPFNGIAQQKTGSAYVDSMLFNSNNYKNNCGIDHLLKELRADPAYVAREKKMNDAIYQRITRQIRTNDLGPASPIVTLPVVVHIINDNPASVTDAMVLAGINDLNDAFSKSGAYAGSQGADTRIRFALAQKDVLGGITTGITRTKSHYGTNASMSSDDSRLKNLIIWDPSKYINVWLVSNIVGEIEARFDCGTWSRINVGGYATLPTGSSSATDGIVIPTFGIVFAHEMGHYLGLYHTFTGGCKNGDCLNDGDMVCDTPPDQTNTPAANCSSPGNSCTTDTLSSYSNGFFPRDTTDQASNFMDYNNAACTNQFTEGQAVRMRAVIATQRSGLALDAVTKPCAGTVLAGFTRDVADPKIGEVIQFTNTSSNAVTYQWIVDGNVLGATPNFTYSFPAPIAKHSVTLKATDISGCFSTYTDYILVNCGVTARFSNNKLKIASQTGVLTDSILFTNNSMNTLGGAPSYQWKLIDNGIEQIISTNTAPGSFTADDLSYRFPSFGNFTIRLIATNAGCVDSVQMSIPVEDPRPDAYISLTAASCFQTTKVRLSFYVCNFGYAGISPNMPVSFYDNDPAKPGAKQIGKTFFIPDSVTGVCCGRVYADTLDIGYENLNQVFAVVNNITTAIPVVLPDAAQKFQEKDYTNNISSFKNFQFKATVTPAVATIEPGDTLQLQVRTTPDAASNYAWSPPSGLNCINCGSPFYIADTAASTTKQVIVRSSYQCVDTAFVEIKVPTYNDFTVAINSIACAGTDSLSVSFTISNLFKRGGIPKNLLVSFYKDDPATVAASLAGPVFKVPDSLAVKQQTYTTKIKKLSKGNSTIFASVNDKGTQIPVQASSYSLPEKLYNNNTASFVYKPATRIIDSSICSGDTLSGYAVSGTYTDLFTTAAGCDSIRILNLVVKSIAVQRTDISIVICRGETYAGYSVSGTYVDVFKAVNSCDSIRTLHLLVHPGAATTNTIHICKGSSYIAGGKVQTQSGIYIDSLKTINGCDSIVTTELMVHQLPANFLPADTSVCISKTLPVSLTGYNAVIWNTGGNSNSISVTQPGAYSAQVVDRYGCSGADTINVAFVKCVPIQIPSAFTPNGDFKNDTFKPLIGVATNNYRMQIYNRWGQLIFETNNSLQGWDGKYGGVPQPNGTYVYHISFTDPDGFVVDRRGTVVLIK